MSYNYVVKMIGGSTAICTIDVDMSGEPLTLELNSAYKKVNNLEKTWNSNKKLPDAVRPSLEATKEMTFYVEEDVNGSPVMIPHEGLLTYKVDGSIVATMTDGELTIGKYVGWNTVELQFS